MKKGVIIVAIALLLLLIWWGAIQYLSLNNIKALATDAAEFTTDHTLLVALILVLGQAIGMTLAMPTKAVLTLLAGALLGPFVGTVITEVGVLTGATILFFAARHLFRETFVKKIRELGKRIEARLTTHPVRALMGLRMCITLPYGPVTLAAGLSRMSYRQFLVGTLIGDVPVVAAYSIAAHKLFTLTRLQDALSPWTMGVFIAVGLFVFITAIIGKRSPL